MMRLPDAALPTKGLLREYVDFASPLTDAPGGYHLAVGLTVLAALLGNRVSIPFGARRLFPNLYVTLLGRSTFSRKTTSIAIGQKILDHFESVANLPSEFSPEAFLDRLGKSPAGLLVYPELARALTTFRRDYMSGMVERLTELYDCPPVYSRELRGRTFSIEQPAVSILAASTVEWLAKTMGEDDVRGGFFPRFVFVPEGQQPQHLAIPPEPDAQVEQHLVQGLSRLVNLRGKADLTVVRGIYQDWYRKLVTSLYARDDGDALSSFAGRLCVTALKLALLYHVAEADDLVISPEALQRALSFVGWVQETTASLLQDGLALGRWDKDRKRILGKIRARPGIPHSALLRASHLPARGLREIVATLEEEGSIVAQPNEGVRHYYPVP